MSNDKNATTNSQTQADTNKENGDKKPVNEKKRGNKKALWISLAAIVSIAIIVVLVVVLAGGNKGKDIDTNTNTDTDLAAFSPSDGIDENGFWKDIKALDLVELFDYKSMSIPNDIHQVSDVALQSTINQLLLEFSSEPVQVKDRAVADGDMVNISYVGSVDGIVFEGGSTGDEGADVIAGSANYIDDFLTQIIGYMPGETVNVEVTFPEVYSQNPDLQNKNAVFVTTINYIEETVQPELTDEFVEKNLSAEYGWKTVDELKDGMRDDLKRTALEGYVWEYLSTSVKVSSMPDKLTDYFEKSMLNYYQSYAELYEMKLDEFLISYVGVSNKDELIANNKEENHRQAVYCLVCQAIAENAGISVNEEDLIKYFGSDYVLTEEEYGLPFLKQYALDLKIIDYIIENAVLE